MEEKVDVKGILAVIPAFNEEHTIPKVISGLQKLYSGLDILVIDDGSSDNTAAVSRRLKARAISLPFNLGYGVALQTGFRYALMHQYAYLVHLDADGQHEVASIETLLEGIQDKDVDIIIGSRFLKEPDYSVGRIRKTGIVIFRAITSIVLGQKITDPTSGFQALNKKAFNFYTHFYPVDFPDADMIITAHLAGLKIRELPVKMYPRAFGKSMHSGLKPVYYVFKMFLSILVTILRARPKIDHSQY